MEALRVQRTGHGASAGLISRAGAPVGGASSRRAYGAGARPDRADRVGVRCAPFTQAAGLVEPGEAPASAGGFGAGAAELLHAIAAVNASAVAAPGALAMADYTEAAHYAGMAEELSRTVEYLQILSAGAVDRTRTRAINEAATRAARNSRNGRSWVTGWDNGTETLNETDTSWPGNTAPATTPTEPSSPADDGCKNTAEFLRLSLRIGISEARRRLHLAHDTLPATTLTGDTTPPPREHLAAGLAPTTPDTATDADTNTTDLANTAPGQENPGQRSGGSAVSSRAGTIISLTLDRLQHQTTPETLARIEHDLTRTAATADPDFLARVARRWAETLDADGIEPTEEALRHTQGAFIRKPRHGLHHLEIFATTDQYEHLLTVMNTATNPRTTSPDTSGADTGTGTGTGEDVWLTTDPDLDRRTRPQKQLDGIIGAVKAALTTNILPTTGGNRPQIIATINYHDLLPHNRTSTATDGGDGAAGPSRGPAAGAVWAGASGADAVWAGSGARAGIGLPGGTGTGNFVFTGPVAAATLRKIACDADIIPALLGTHGEILDLGRKTRLFTPAQRLALTARDQGCTFPNCTIPAPWCEAHHITYWSQDGPTNLDNGALLCTHHHHLIHKEQWTITSQNGVPWYTPPRHIDPTQKPQQNHYFKPPPPARE